VFNPVLNLRLRCKIISDAVSHFTLADCEFNLLLFWLSGSSNWLLFVTLYDDKQAESRTVCLPPLPWWARNHTGKGRKLKGEKEGGMGKWKKRKEVENWESFYTVTSFLANVNSLSRSLYVIARPSVCRLSSVVCRLSVVCNVRTPYSVDCL